MVDSVNEVSKDFNDDELEAFLREFEEKGAAISDPVLPEGNYRANLMEISARQGEGDDKKTGEKQYWTNWQVSFELDSTTAQSVMKRDNVRVYADREAIFIGKNGAYLNTTPMGIDKSNNSAFWNFVGKLFASAGLAEAKKDDSGAEQYLIDGNIIRSIYQGTSEKKAELKAAADFNIDKLPGLLAEHQLKNLTELLTAEEDTRKCYVHIVRGTAYKDTTKMRHFVKNMMLASDFESDSNNMESLMA